MVAVPACVAAKIVCLNAKSPAANGWQRAANAAGTRWLVPMPRVARCHWSCAAIPGRSPVARFHLRRIGENKRGVRDRENRNRLAHAAAHLLAAVSLCELH